MYLCDKEHDEIVFTGTFGDKCPLCRAKQHSDRLVDFIESKGLGTEYITFEETPNE